MAFIEAAPEILGAFGEGGGATAAEGGGGLGGMMKDFNDNPVAKTIGSHLGHALLGGGGGQAPPSPDYIGPVGQMQGKVVGAGMLGSISKAGGNLAPMAEML